MAETDEIPNIEGLKAAIDVTKLLITLAGAGMAFVMSVAPGLVVGLPTKAGYAAIAFLGISIAAGLFVLFQSATNLSNRNFELSGNLIKVPGVINTVFFALGVIAVGTIALAKIQTTPIKKAPAKKIECCLLQKPQPCAKNS